MRTAIATAAMVLQNEKETSVFFRPYTEDFFAAQLLP